MKPADLVNRPPADGRQMARAARVAVLAAVDLCALFAAGGLAYVLWALPMKGQTLDLYVSMAPLVALFTLGYAQAGLYPGFGVGPVETLRRYSYVTAFSFLVLAAFSFALKLPPLYSRMTFALAFVASLVIVPLGRTLILRLARRWTWWSEPVVVIGTGVRAARAIRSIQAGHLGYRPVAVLALQPDTAEPDTAQPDTAHPGTTQPGTVPTDIEGVPVCGDLSQAARLAALGARVALLETDQSHDRATIDRLQRDFRHVVLLREYHDLPIEGIQVRNLGGVIGIEYTNNLLLHGNRVVKRTLDVLIAGLMLVAAGPVIACATALVWLIDGRPVFFRQHRDGFEGRRLAVPKIRTMRRDAEQRLAASLEADPALRAEWEASYKLKDDPRLIPIVGRMLRRYSVDELPQLWSVLQGRMSLVGPRPFPGYHMRQFPSAFLELRQRVRPGITGLWQVSVRSEGGIEQQEAYDTYYIRNWSVWLDVYVLSRTIAAVASGRGAY